MALSSAQISDILFKKIATGKSTTDNTRKFFEEPYNGRPFVDLSQIWAQSSLIPNVAAPVTNVVSYVIDLSLQYVLGTAASFTCNTKNIIPFNYGDGISYNYTLKKSDNTLIPFGTNDWYLDTETGTLTFFGGLPAGVSSLNSPKLTFYKYIGKTAADTGIGGGSSVPSLGEWQDSVIDFITVLPPSNNDLDRYIYNSTSSVVTTIYDIINQTLSSGTINQYDIIEYHVVTNGTNNSTSGWRTTIPSMGMFTSIDAQAGDFANNIYYFNTTTKWTPYSRETTYPHELILSPQDTFVNGTNGTYSHVISNITIDKKGSLVTDVNLYVNGVRLKSSEYNLVSLNALSLNYVSSNTVRITLNSVVGITLGNPIKIVVGSTVYWRVVILIIGNIVYFSGTPIVGITNGGVYTITSMHTIPQIGDYIMINSILGYDIEVGSDPDDLLLMYVTANP